MKFIIFLFFIASISVSAEENKVHPVSVINLVATPERFDGKTIMVSGELTVVLKGLSPPFWLSLSSKNFDPYSMIVLHIPHEYMDDMLNEHGRFYQVTGVFQSCASPIVDGALCYLSITPNRVGSNQRVDMRRQD